MTNLSDVVKNLTQLEVMIVPGVGGQADKRMVCPECGRYLPLDPVTECDQCGAHLEVYVETVAPAVEANDPDDTRTNRGPTSGPIETDVNERVEES